MRKKLLLMAGSVFFALLIGEVGARVILPLLPDPPGTSFIGDDACMYRLRPSGPDEFPEYHDHHINQLGFRDRNHAADKPADSFRVLGLGDSFVYGAGPIQENFLRVAERELNHQAGKKTNLLLMGVPGWSTENQVGYLKDKGLALKPDLVLVNFFIGNDVTGIPVRGRIIRGNLYPTTSPLPMRNLLRKSQLFVMFESVIWRGRMKKSREEDSALAPTAGSAVNDMYLKIVDQNLPVYLNDPDPGTAALWAEAEGYLEEIDAACAAAKVPWILVLIPGEIQVDPDIRAQVLTGLDLSPEVYDFDSPQRRLARWADSHQVAMVDLLPPLRREHQRGPRLYVPNDTHWNRRGNLIAGTFVAEVLRDQPNRLPEGD